MLTRAQDTRSTLPTLEQPTLNAFSRTRTAKLKPASSTVFQGCGVRKTKPPRGITVETRLQQFPGHTLCKSAGLLFCRSCKMQLSLLKQSIVVHTSSKRHNDNKILYLESRRDDEDVKAILSEYFAQNPDEVHATLSEETNLFRWRVVEKMMEEGIALNKVNALKELLERSGERLTDSSHLATFVPKITQREKDTLVCELKGEHGCVIFDGTTRLGEATAVLWRHCPADFYITQRLVALRTTAKHLKGDDLYRLLGSILLRDLDKQTDEVIADSRDSCATNGVAERLLLMLCPAIAPNKCCSHILVGTGQHIKLPYLGIFMLYLIQLLTHSFAFRIAFKEVFGQSMPNYSTIRWWSRFDLMEVLALGFSKLDKLISVLEERNVGDASTKGLREVYDANSRELRRELAMMMDLKCFRDATYTLEGDQLEGLLLVDTIEPIRNKGRTLSQDSSNMPNLAAVLRSEKDLVVGTRIYEFFGAPYNEWFEGKVTKVIPGPQKMFMVKYSDGKTITSDENEVRRWIRIHDSAEYQQYCGYASGAFTYLENRLTDNCAPAYHYKDVYKMWALARHFNPAHAAQFLLHTGVDELINITPLHYHGLIDGMKHEVHAYLAACANLFIDMSDIHVLTADVLLFWRRNHHKFPTWAKAARIIFAMTPNSAGAERVFSLMKAMFGDDRSLSLADLLEGSLMLKYNKTKRKAEQDARARD